MGANMKPGDLVVLKTTMRFYSSLSGEFDVLVKAGEMLLLVGEDDYPYGDERRVFFMRDGNVFYRFFLGSGDDFFSCESLSECS